MHNQLRLQINPLRRPQSIKITGAAITRQIHRRLTDGLSILSSPPAPVEEEQRNRHKRQNNISAATITCLTVGEVHCTMCRLTPDVRYDKFKRYFVKLVEIGRQVLAKDHTYDRCGLRFTMIDRYVRLRDTACNWITRSTNATLFKDRYTYAFLAQMAIIMRTIEIALALPHRDLDWPGAAPGPELHWPAVLMQEAYGQVDELIFKDQEVDVKAMLWVELPTQLILSHELR